MQLNHKAWQIGETQMTDRVITNLEKLLGGPRDGALLRYSLGNEWLKAGEPTKAVAFLEDAVRSDPAFTAAWKLLGKALAESGNLPEALAAYERGIAVAESKGDIQAGKEMRVFVKRLRKPAT